MRLIQEYVAVNPTQILTLKEAGNEGITGAPVFARWSPGIDWRHCGYEIHAGGRRYIARDSGDDTLDLAVRAWAAQLAPGHYDFDFSPMRDDPRSDSPAVTVRYTAP